MNKTHGLTNTPEHKVWMSMRSRVKDKYKAQWYKDKGIYVCARWSGKQGFQNFLIDMGKRPPGTWIDRKDGNGPYCPENCKWATIPEQMKNRKKMRFSRTGRKLYA